MTLITTVLKLGKASRRPRSEHGRARLSRCLDAVDEIDRSLERYVVEAVFQRGPGKLSMHGLRHLRDRPSRVRLEELLARADTRPAFLSLLFDYAVALDLLQPSGEGDLVKLYEQ